MTKGFAKRDLIVFWMLGASPALCTGMGKGSLVVLVQQSRSSLLRGWVLLVEGTTQHRRVCKGTGSMGTYSTAQAHNTALLEHCSPRQELLLTVKNQMSST